ncbi:1,2-diacylglycerol 3-glucosyltransferase [Fodinisporobacter ferrooxydans]|uniref:1,2-diacylglycerol 3-glucosyltransferase n=1 Tax=Fodinisporobacter ferrooxydans TaxID=2901836 RepID=A0ABY4CEQ8_9BACL|nr:1,2-diacylglycerol 3-glucosyltransferase [Alicyclobacillaceae bacterium MYW30-H2]
MQKLRKALILSASCGEGHQQASLAIQEAMKRIDPAIEVRIEDYLKMVHPIVDAVARYCYIQSVRYAPPLYSLFYHRTKNLKSSSRIQKYLNQLGMNELKNYIQEFKPDIVISTFPTPAGVMSVLKESGTIQVPSATVITDHAIHNQWIHPYTDMYFVGSHYVKQGLIHRGVSENKIHVTGIPIRSLFQEPVDQIRLLQKYRVNPELPTVLVMGGSFGVLKDIANICEELFTYATPIQVLVVCGRNEKLYHKINELAKHSSNFVQVFGFVQEINELMAISDVMITKAGGLTISESLAMELPMLLYRPIPGQEQQNASFLVDSNVAVLAKTRHLVSEYMQILLSTNTDHMLQDMRENAKRIKKTDAADQIYKILQKSIQAMSKEPALNLKLYKNM